MLDGSLRKTFTECAGLPPQPPWCRAGVRRFSLVEGEFPIVLSRSLWQGCRHRVKTNRGIIVLNCGGLVQRVVFEYRGSK